MRDKELDAFNELIQVNGLAKPSWRAWLFNFIMWINTGWAIVMILYCFLAPLWNAVSWGTAIRALITEAVGFVLLGLGSAAILDPEDKRRRRDDAGNVPGDATIWFMIACLSIAAFFFLVAMLSPRQ